MKAKYAIKRLTGNIECEKHVIVSSKYLSGKVILTLKQPPENGLSSGPVMRPSKTSIASSSSKNNDIPGVGDLASMASSFFIRTCRCILDYYLSVQLE